MTEFHRTSIWLNFVKQARPIIARSLPQPCVNAFSAKGCTGVVMQGERFDVAHVAGRDHMLTKSRVPTLADVGPAHPSCNRSAGARLAATRRRTQRARDERMPNW